MLVCLLYWAATLSLMGVGLCNMRIWRRLLTTRLSYLSVVLYLLCDNEDIHITWVNWSTILWKLTWVNDDRICSWLSADHQGAYPDQGSQDNPVPVSASPLSHNLCVLWWRKMPHPGDSHPHPPWHLLQTSWPSHPILLHWSPGFPCLRKALH